MSISTRVRLVVPAILLTLLLAGCESDEFNPTLPADIATYTRTIDRTYELDPQGALAMPEGGVLLHGTSAVDGWLMKISEFGDVISELMLDQPLHDVVPTSQGFLAAVDNGGILELLDLSAAGTEIWRISDLGPAEDARLVTRPGGGFVLASMQDDGSGGSILTVALLDADGVETSTETYSYAATTWLIDMAIDADGVVGLVTQTSLVDVPLTLLLQPTDPAGPLTASPLTFHPAEHPDATATSISAPEGGGFYIAGGTNEPNGPTRVMWTTQYANDGTRQWVYRHTVDAILAQTMARTSDGGYLICATGGTPTDYQAQLIRLSAGRALLWQRSLGADLDADFGVTVLPLVDDYLFTVIRSYRDNHSRLTIARLNPDGNMD